MTIKPALTKDLWYTVKIGTVVGLMICGGLNALFQSAWMLIPICLLFGTYVYAHRRTTQ